MRKIISILSAAILLIISVFSTLPLNIFANQGNLYTEIDFGESMYQSTAHYSYASVVDSGNAAHGAVAKFTSISTPNTNSTTFYNWPNAIRLANATGDAPVALEKGKIYKITFDIRKVSNGNPTNTENYPASDFNINFVIDENPNLGLGNIGLDYKDRFELVTTESKICSGNWYNVTAYFEPQASGTPIMILKNVSNNWFNVPCEIYFDNFVIEEVEEKQPITIDVTYNEIDPEEGGTETITHAIGDPLNKPYYGGYYFEGWYTDRRLRNPASDIVTFECKELYAKWSTDTREPQTLNVNYDNVIGNGGGYQDTLDGYGTQLMFDGTQLYDVARYSSHILWKGWAGEDQRVTGPDGQPTRVAHITGAQKYDWPWPSALTMYDFDNRNPKFVPNANSAYKIKFDYKVNKKPSHKLYVQWANTGNISNPYNSDWKNAGFYSLDFLSITDVTNPEINNGWATCEGIIYTGSNVYGLNMMLASSDIYGEASDVDIYFDNFEITEILELSNISFNVNGGNSISPVNCVVGEAIPALSTPVRTGYIFAGWYEDADLTVPFSMVTMPARSLRVYAKWIKAADTATAYSSGFEPDYFEDGVKGYSNTNKNNAVISDNTASENVSWLTGDKLEANTGEGRLYFDNTSGKYTSQSATALSAALLNPDGSYFQIVKGQRYRISYSAKFSGHASGEQTISFVTADGVPNTGLGVSNTKSFASVTFVGDNNITNYEWFSKEDYFLAEETAKVFVIAYSPYTNQAIELDDITITPVDETEATIISYYKADGSLYKYFINKIGSKFKGVSGINKNGDTFGENADYAFAGWVDKDGKQFLGSKFPAQDIDLYPSYKDITPVQTAPDIEYATDTVCDYEDAESVKAYYDSRPGYAPDQGLAAVVDDPDGAHSGNGYFKYTSAGHWMNQYFRTTKFYDSNSKDNLIWLEPNSAYRVSYYIKVEKAGACNLYLVGFNDAYRPDPEAENQTPDTVDKNYGYTILAENYMTDGALVADFGKYKLYETTVITEDLPVVLGLSLYGGYLTASIDDVTVTKLVNVKIDFETNGGSEIDTIEQLSYSTVMQPADPVREGYRFKGWYSDPEFKNPFDFANTLITANTKIYAKWEAEKQSEPIYEDKITYTYRDEIVQIVPEDAELDDAVVINKNDTIGEISKQNNTKTDSNTESDSLAWWIILIIVIAAIVVLGVIALVIIIIVRRKASK